MGAEDLKINEEKYEEPEADKDFLEYGVDRQSGTAHVGHSM